ASLVEHIRTSLIIQAEMFRRILDGDPRPSLLLAEVLEDAGNRYIDFSKWCRPCPRTKLAVEQRRVSLLVGTILHRQRHRFLEPRILRAEQFFQEAHHDPHRLRFEPPVSATAWRRSLT